MKSVILCLLFSVFSFSNLSAQEDSKADSTKINSLQEGSWSVQFRITSNFNLSSFIGNNLSVKYHLAPHHAIRLGIAINGYNRSQDNNQQSNSEITDNQKINDFSILLRPQYIYYPYTDKSVVLFLGAGPYLRYDYLKLDGTRKHNVADTLVYSDIEYRKQTRSYFGLSIVAGVEVFILDFLSLHAEYGSLFYYSHYKQDREVTREYSKPESSTSTTNTKGKDDNYYFTPESVLFGVSIYF